MWEITKKYFYSHHNEVYQGKETRSDDNIDPKAVVVVCDLIDWYYLDCFHQQDWPRSDWSDYFQQDKKS